MRILVTGGKGQLGSAIIKLLDKKACALGVIDKVFLDSEVMCMDKSTLNIVCMENVKHCLMAFKPHIVLNAAAYTQVDRCESDIDLSFEVNSLGPRNLAIACEEVQAKLVHISTDYVFDGKSRLPYREFELPNPINVYGKTKRLGEEYVRQFCSRYLIVRTGWLYGYEGKNFVKTIIKASKEKKCLQVVDDQIGSPTNAEDLAYHLLCLASKDEYGLYHCTGNGECSWYEFAKAILQYAQIDCAVNPISSGSYNSAAERPLYSVLDHGMLRCTIGDKMRDWQEALEDFIKGLADRRLL